MASELVYDDLSIDFGRTNFLQNRDMACKLGCGLFLSPQLKCSMSNTMNLPLNDDWHEVIFALNEISLFIKRTHMIACIASTENVASWQVIDYILFLSTCSPAQPWSLHSLILQFYTSRLGLLTNFFFNPHWEPFHRLNLWRSNCVVNLKCIILRLSMSLIEKSSMKWYHILLEKVCGPIQGFFFQPHPLGIPVLGGGGGFMKIPLPFWMEKTFIFQF